EIGASQEVLKHFYNIQNTEHFYDPVVDIEKGSKQVYDLTVPDGASFTANGLVNHNSTITSCIITYEAYRLLNKYSPQEYYGIMPEDEIKMCCISTSKETAGELYQKVVGHIQRSEFFRKYRGKPTAQHIRLRTQRDLDKYGSKTKGSLVIRVAPCSAKGLRGPTNIVVALDEMAFFFVDENTGARKSSSRDHSDTAIYNAVTPSIAKFKNPVTGVQEGKIICISSPGPKSGKFYEEYERSYKEDEGKDLHMIQASTWEVDPDLSTDYLRNKYRENPIVFRSEFGAEFSDRMFGWIEDPEMVRQNVVPGMKYKMNSMSRTPHFMGIDLGLVHDGTSICIGHWTEEEGEDGVMHDKIEVDVCDVRYASEEKRDYFEPEEMAEWISTYTDKFYIVKALADQYYGMAVMPILEKKGLKQFEYRQFTDVLNSNTYQNLLTQFLSNALRLPEGDPIKVGEKINKDSELVQEILSLQAEQRSRYIIKVSAPDRKGMHDDRSDGFARMVLLATEYKNKVFNYKASLAPSSRLSSYRAIRHTERVKASLNRPGKGYRGFASRRPVGPVFNQIGRR
ncbi:MAG: hypothetical protein GF334_11435, partial [Candidatus Altiarchaeales archaeon]|nr:hypothetical protein [Candidatus Altiarchaeales archaeon]